jgi:hypothetical protein
MVIHDMRNPTTSIKVGLEQTLQELGQIKMFQLDQTEFHKKCETLQEQIKLFNYDRNGERINSILQ